MNAAPTYPVSAAVGQRVKVRRAARGVSQAQLGDALGVTHQMIQKYETGKNKISVDTLARIARFLDAPISAFLEGLEPEPVPGDGALTRDAAIVAGAFLRLPPEQRTPLKALVLSMVPPA